MRLHSILNLLELCRLVIKKDFITHLEKLVDEAQLSMGSESRSISRWKKLDELSVPFYILRMIFSFQFPPEKSRYETISMFRKKIRKIISNNLNERRHTIQ